MNNIPTNESTYGRPCVDGLCYCDWRLTITGCYDEDIFRYINIVIIAITSCIVLVGLGLLYHRLINLKQVVFEYRNNFVRPRAMEAILFFMVLFNILRLIHTIVLVTDTAQNIIFRQFLFEFSYEMGFTCLGVYLFGIIHALRESDRAIFDQWIYSPLFADILCTSIIVGPYLTNTICSLGAGISAHLGYTEQANGFAQALYTVWTAHCLALSSLTLFAGWRLIRILNTHITRKEESRTNIDISKVKLGASKVKIIAFTSAICLYLYAGVSITYGTIRVKIITHAPVSLLFCVAWNGLGIVASIFIAFAVILNPKMKLSLLFTSDSSGALRSHGMELDSSRKNNSGGTGSKYANKHGTSTNQGNSMTATATGTYIDSTFETHTFDDSVLYSSKIRDLENAAHTDDPTRNYTSMDAAPTLSTAIAMQYSNRSNPLVLDDHDAELVHAYPESTKSCSHLVNEKDAHVYG
ncbi:hypothetical protein BCR42DRAFT_406298 [Absidia repens]|uniref:Uncharacterized protein n=1 Tax=Absidia repens TaxID=90262 RepID=A0A1X2IWA9_9FUNG|nr:hypothetical protein BCR42DRAFT_406298 [Absidia repens]